MNNIEAKKHATTLLRRYDKMRHELRLLERELSKACSDYGRSKGVWGYNRDYMRAELEMERKAKEKAA